MKKLFLVSIILTFLGIETYSQQCTSCDNTVNTGQYSSAIGKNTVSQGLTSFASGFGSEAQGFYTTALGFYSYAVSSKDIAIGSSVMASGGKSIVIGAGEWNSGTILTNPVPRSLMVGFNSHYPTLFVSESPSTAYFDKTGKIGIGNITVPEAKLHLLADEEEPAAIFIQPYSWENNESATLLLGSLGSNITATKNEGMRFYSENDYIFNNGFVGINTLNPEYNLHVNGGTFTKAFRLYDEKMPPKEGYVLFSDDLGNAYWNDPNEFSLWRLNENGEDIYRINGNVGIGTINTYGYKLAVNGKIITEELMVKHPVNWPDYVFKKGYELKGLKELEEFITNEHHLPEIPTEQEVAENGIAVGQMNGLLLKKIEELTLYIIEQQKQMDKMENRLSELED